MTKHISILSELVEEALQHTDISEPKHLIASLSKMANPFRCASENERRELGKAYAADFSAIYIHHTKPKHFESIGREKCVARLAWLLSSMKATEKVKPNAVLLVTMLRTALAFKNFGSIWEFIPFEFFTENLNASMSGLIGSTEYSFSAEGNVTPIWEREAVDDFLKAEAENDWPMLESLWLTIISTIMPDADLSEAIACLNATELGQKTLALTLDKTGSILAVSHAAKSMNSFQIARLATYSTSNMTRFGLVQSLVFNHPRKEPLAAGVTDDLASVFGTIQGDQVEWAKWMQALNKHPVRSIRVQSALGISMVGSHSATKSAYLDAFNLITSHGECRIAVSDCLSTFCRKAPINERKDMWRLCYQRWNNWNFDEADKKTFITHIAVCDLDYAIIGYFTECFSEADFAAILQTASDALSECRREWHKDHLSYDDAWYRVLSRWVIIAYASLVRKGEQPWELPTKILLPFDPATNRYDAMSMRTNMPIGVKVCAEK